MVRKQWLTAFFILSIGLSGLFSLDAAQHPARAEAFQQEAAAIEAICDDWSSVGTITTIWSDLPDPSRAGQTIRVVWMVRPKSPYWRYGLPGNVRVTGGGATCQGPVYGGCLLTISTPGSYVITARYSGGMVGMCYIVGSSDTEPHTVNR
jgi:hypothetical protein